MSVTPSSTIVGVFTDRANAEQALDALYNAGITNEQVRYSGSESSGSFLDDLKSLFTGQNAGDNVAHDLTDLGLSNEEANYYANEHNNGHAVVAVRAPGREAEVQGILQQHGSLGTQPQAVATDDSIDNQPTIQQPVVTNYTDEVQHTNPSTTAYDTTEQHDASSTAIENTPPITHDNVTEPAHTESVSDDQGAHSVVLDGSLPQDTANTTSSYDTNPTGSYDTNTNSSYDTNTTSNYDTNTNPSYTEQQPQLSSQDVQSPTTEYATTDSTTDTQSTTTENAATDPHATSDAMIESETAPQTTNEDSQVAPESYTQESENAGIPDIQTTQPVATTSDYSSEDQLSDDQAMAAKVPTQPLVKNSTSTDASTPTSNDVYTPTSTDASTPTSNDAQLSTVGVGTSSTTMNDTDDLQSLQTQIASVQQQLQDAKAQLQAAKEREEQTRAAREREQQLQNLRQQLQALQAELDATHSAIQETQSRIGGY